MKKLFSILLSAALMFTVSWGQISHGGIPVSLTSNLRLDPAVHLLPPADIDRLLAEDAAQGNDAPLRFGTEIPMNISPDTIGDWEATDAGVTWRISIYAPGAVSLAFRYDRFNLPAGAKLFLYTPGFETILGSFTDANNKPDGYFATGSVPGDYITIELTMNSRDDNLEFNIHSAVWGYRDVFSAESDRSGWCNNNINCPEGEPWQDDKRSVVKLELGMYLCSGALINNVNEDGMPYLYTAYHCIEDSGNPSYWVLRFNYESSTCYGNYGPNNETTVGSLVRATSSDIYNSPDFALLELTDDIPADYEVYYSGWSRSTSYPQQPVGIHHPDGDIKKISFDYDSASHYNTNKWNVSWDDGVTEPGSSGSPLFDADHFIIGDLSTGCSSCDDQQCPDQYGKFYRAWDYGSTADMRLRDWLDPDNTDLDYLNGFDPNNPSGIFLGDVNLDEILNVQDIILVVNFIMGNAEPDNYQTQAADVNEDGVINVLDVIAMVGVILGNSD